MRVEIVGGIASGKTTLATLLAKHGMLMVPEPYEVNPFLASFYENPPAFAFETEITFLMQHFSAIKNSHDSAVVCDFSLGLDLAYARTTLGASDQRAFSDLLRYAEGVVGPPKLMVRICCRAEEELRRIRSRGRTVESSIDIYYLNALNNAIEEVLSDASGRAVPVIAIDSEKCDYRDGGVDCEAVARQVMSALADLGPRTQQFARSYAEPSIR